MKSVENSSTRSSRMKFLHEIKYRKSAIVMGVVCLIILICISIYISVCDSETKIIDENIKTLQLASILFRHGARTPTNTYDTDPYKNYPWPGGFGALTNLGKMQLFNLGITIRNRYYGFLPDDYSDDDIFIRSSDKSRTLMSAYTFLSGLYPPTSNQTWNPDIKWQPIPVHSLPREIDAVLAAKKSCIEYDKHEKEIMESAEYKRINSSFQDVYDVLSSNINKSLATPLRVELLYSTLTIEKDTGLILPHWADELLDRMKEISAISLSLHTFDDFMIKTKAGPLLSEIIQNMKKKTSGELIPSRKMFIYSAHDLTIVNMWRALSLREYILPEYGAALILELHSTNTTDSEVKFLYYNNTHTKVPHQLEIPNCKTPCLLSTFEEVSTKYIPVDWEKECGNL